jgi:hypothetical protein
LVLTRTHPPANPATDAVKASQIAARNLSEIPPKFTRVEV